MAVKLAADGWEGQRPHWLLITVDDLALADGIRFTDPPWAVTHPSQDGHDIGASVFVAFAGHDPLGIISRSDDGKPTQWTVLGTGYDDLCLSPSIFVNPKGTPPGWHGFITNGNVTNA